MAKTTATSTPRAKKPTKAEVAAATKANLEMTTEQHEITEEQRVADRRANDQIKADAMSQFVAQQTGTATPPAAMADFNKALNELKEKFGVTADVKVKPAKADKKMQNGVVRPAENTLCGKVWATADAISTSTHTVCAIAALREHADMARVNEHTIKTQYAKWRQYNGVVGRLPKISAVHQQQGEYHGIPTVEPKAAD